MVVVISAVLLVHALKKNKSQNEEGRDPSGSERKLNGFFMYLQEIYSFLIENIISGLSERLKKDMNIFCRRRD